MSAEQSGGFGCEAEKTAREGCGGGHRKELEFTYGNRAGARVVRKKGAHTQLSGQERGDTVNSTGLLVRDVTLEFTPGGERGCSFKQTNIDKADKVF